MNIVVTADNNKELIVFPLIPENPELKTPSNNEEFETINNGTLNLIGEIGLRSINISSIFPKDKKGNAVKKLSNLRVDADKTKAGIQELKQWQGMMEYVQSFKQANDTGVAQMPDKYKAKLGRIVAKPSWNPLQILAHPGVPTILALVFIGFIFCGILIIIILVKSGKKRRRRRKSNVIL